jgi:predicted outer membrane repeat protein
MTLHCARLIGVVPVAIMITLGTAAQAAGVVGNGTPASCTDAALNTALAGGGTVTFNCGAAPVTIVVIGSKIISTSTTIDGGGLVTLSGGGLYPIINSGGTIALTLQNLTLTGGQSTGNNGSALATSPGVTLTMTNVTVNGNGAVGAGDNAVSILGPATIQSSNFYSNEGGAIAISGSSVSISDTTFSNNHSALFDGAAILLISGTLSVTGSTFSYNTASGAFGGGAIFSQGAATIVNSTFYGNGHSSHQGGAITSSGAGAQLTLANVTISGNVAVGGGGGVSVVSGAALAINTIFDGNTGNCAGTFASAYASTYNLSSDATCTYSPGLNNLANTGAMLGPLANNGGPTPTMALLPGSPAIDAGNPSALALDACAPIDQRGITRPQGARCDIGAYEYAPFGLVGVVSRKTHGSAGAFDLPIDTTQPIGGAVTVEPRAIGTGHQLVFQFNGPVTIQGTASAVNPQGFAIGTALPAVAGTDIVVTLTNVPDVQRVTVGLTGVNGALNGNASLGFLLGDVNGSRAVSATDILQVKGHSGQVTDSTNFRFDLNASGAISASDILIVKGRSGVVLP